MHQRFFLIGALLAAAGVGLGAIGAHALKSALPDWYPDPQRQLEAWESAVFWQMVHAIGLMVIAVSPLKRAGRGLTSGWMFLVGTLLFSGFLYAWVLTGQTWMVAPVPVGGVVFILGWIALAVAAARVPWSEPDRP